MGKLDAKSLPRLAREKAKKHPDGSGLYFCARPSSSYWMLRYTANGKRREHTLGHYPDLSLADARQEAALMKRSVRHGIDPIAEKKRPGGVNIQTVDELAEDWLANDIGKRLKHPQIPRRIYKKECAPHIGELSLNRVKPTDIRAILERVVKSERPATANDTLMYCKQMFRHGVKLGLLSSNPAEAFQYADAGGVEESRDRCLTEEELAVVFETLRKYPSQFPRESYLAVALYLCLGIRKTELTMAQWQEFDFESAIWNLQAVRNKTAVTIQIPLAPQVLEWLKELRARSCGSDYVFPARRSGRRGKPHIAADTLNHALAKLFGKKVDSKKRPLENVFAKAGIEYFTIHDLRRTFRTLLADAGVSYQVAERSINHKLKGVEGIYDRHDYLEERREALNGIANVVAAYVDPAPEASPVRLDSPPMQAKVNDVEFTRVGLLAVPFKKVSASDRFPSKTGQERISALEQALDEYVSITDTLQRRIADLSAENHMLRKKEERTANAVNDLLGRLKDMDSEVMLMMKRKLMLLKPDADANRARSDAIKYSNANRHGAVKSQSQALARYIWGALGKDLPVGWMVPTVKAYFDDKIAHPAFEGLAPTDENTYRKWISEIAAPEALRAGRRPKTDDRKRQLAALDLPSLAALSS